MNEMRNKAYKEMADVLEAALTRWSREVQFSAAKHGNTFGKSNCLYMLDGPAEYTATVRATIERMREAARE